MIKQLPKELLYNIVEIAPSCVPLLQLRITCRDLYYDDILLKKIKQKSEYHKYLHDYYFILLLSFSYYNADIKRKIFDELHKIHYLTGLWNKLLIYFKQIIKKKYLMNDMDCLEYHKFKDLSLKDVKSIRYTFDKYYPIRVGKVYDTILCNCGSSICENKLYKISDINLNNIKNLNEGCQQGFKFLFKNSIVTKDKYPLIEDLLFH